MTTSLDRAARIIEAMEDGSLSKEEGEKLLENVLPLPPIYVVISLLLMVPITFFHEYVIKILIDTNSFNPDTVNSIGLASWVICGVITLLLTSKRIEKNENQK